MKLAKIETICLIVLLVFSFSFEHSLATKIDEKKAEITEIESALDSINSELEGAVEDYNRARGELGNVKQKVNANKIKISELSTDLKFKQEKLSARIKAAYKSGPISISDVIFESKSFSDFVSRVYVISRIIKQDNELIKSVSLEKTKLEKARGKLLIEKQNRESLLNKVAGQKLTVEEKIAEKNGILRKVKKDLKRLQEEERERIRKIREEALRKLKEQQRQEEARNNAPQNPDEQGGYAGGNSTTTDVIEIAKKYLGVRYQWGGTSPETGFDCSGFAQFVYNQVGVYLPRTSREQHNFLSEKGRLVSEADLQPGDLVFYGPGYVNDVKIYMGAGYIIGANGGRFIPGEVKILPLHYRGDYYGSGRP